MDKKKEDKISFKSTGPVSRALLDELRLAHPQRPPVLILAAVDSGGGAGITADVISVHDNGGWPLPCTTALTAQSLHRVAGVEDVPADMFETTLKLAVSDWPAIRAVKVGFVSSRDILCKILDCLEGPLEHAPVVWDPVLTATAGKLGSADLKAQLKRILAVTDVFTPNISEAMELAGWDEARYDIEGPAELGRVFLEQGAKAVIIKGGHNIKASRAVDTFVSPALSFEMELPKLRGDGAHGGGCAFSSAIAALLARGYAPQDAAVLAKAYVFEGISAPDLMRQGEDRPPVGHHGMPHSLAYAPRVREFGFPDFGGPFRRCGLRLGLYPVVDSPEWVARLTAAGVRTIQLRIKDPDDPKLFEKICKAVSFCRAARARLFVDDWYELAVKAGAYGVHLGMEDLRTVDLEYIRRSGLRLGVSTHGPYELMKALQLNPSYIALGHIFPTNTKAMPSRPQGAAHLREQVALVGGQVPLVAIGGISEDNCDGVIESGVGSVALVSALTKAADPEAAAARWLRRIGSGGDE